MKHPSRILRKGFLMLFTSSILLSACSVFETQDKSAANHREDLQREFIDLRFGMFICYNIMSYGAQWGEADYDISTFNPVDLDCRQWADAAVSAGMKFGLLTTKHHEGFCLWDSDYTDYDVASTPYGKDIVRQYVEAFRSRGLKTGLYYSIWDSTNDIDKGKIDEKKLTFIKGQITELLSNYGDINYFVLDGWFWRMGHHELPFIEIEELVRSLQPNCLITDHTHMQALYHSHIPYFEGPFGAFPEEGNTMPSALGHCCVRGNGWFWDERTPEGLNKGESAESIVEKLTTLESRYCNFMLNCMPNRNGLMDTLFTDLLSDIGKLWSPDLTRPALPSQNIQLIYEVPFVGAFASSGDASAAISATKIPGGGYFEWTADPGLPQSISFDLGVVYEGIEMITLVPKHRCKPGPETCLKDGNITHCKLYSSEDGEAYELLAEKQWDADGQMKTIVFDPIRTRYLKVEVLANSGEHAVIIEAAAGAYSLPAQIFKE